MRRNKFFKKLKWIFKLEVIGLQEMRCKEKKRKRRTKMVSESDIQTDQFVGPTEIKEVSF